MRARQSLGILGSTLVPLFWGLGSLGHCPQLSTDAVGEHWCRKPSHRSIVWTGILQDLHTCPGFSCLLRIKPKVNKVFVGANQDIISVTVWLKSLGLSAVPGRWLGCGLQEAGLPSGCRVGRGCQLGCTVEAEPGSGRGRFCNDADRSLRRFLFRAAFEGLSRALELEHLWSCDRVHLLGKWTLHVCG